MLDGKRYFAEFPDEQPAVPAMPDSRDSIRAALVTLARLEQELARFLRDALAADRNG
jgi:hypothetical protein